MSVSGSVLVALETVVVEEHRVLFGEVLGEAWSPPAAYRWIRYEDPDPIGRLIAASERLEALWAAHPTDLPVYPEVPYAFFGFYLAASTYSTFGILRFTVLSRLGRSERYQRPNASG